MWLRSGAVFGKEWKSAGWGKECVGEGGKACQTFDAFIVKYEASTGQRHLPVHRDQSTHSFTIALNPPEAYSGGGTYICELGESLTPAKGHLLSFEGALLHGGDPVTRGTRYIAVAFCYAEPFAAAQQQSMKTEEPPRKRARAPDFRGEETLADVFAAADAPGGGASFSFSF
ncbi:hypothetical protein T484DRAFT_1921969 [Baffinella frigidus]|nr:hypothetical protein T484DRAFT_1921969 [Cryptophyta sp. CCMP2293]